MSRLRSASPLLAALGFVSVASHTDAQRRPAPSPASTPTPAARPGLPAAALPPDTTTFRTLQWRNIGPFRGGRSVAVAGIPSQPLTYFAGYTGGGLWRTDDAGLSWRNIGDGWFGTGSIGAIAVAPSDPNVLYVGTGEHAIRGQSSTYGDGVYKSTDQGRTWRHVGLRASRQISAVRVHPTNPDIAWVAAQGDRWQGSEERGIYRTTDGGVTWTKVLAGLNATSGASDLSVDPTNPRTLYAAFWDHQRRPWIVRSGGAGSGIWKSTDGGDTWTRLAQGLPALMGKIGVSVSPANPDRVYAIVEAEQGGMYRSDDAGRTWSRTSSDRLIQTRSWYYMKTFADPKNADVVWVTNAPVLRSIDGGRTFATVPATHGDNHQLWIDPIEGRRIINANDGGASISLDGGRSWSSQDNQPTAQFYHVTVDDQYPYRLYSGQQDNTSVIITSRGEDGAIGVRDWTVGPGCESANVGVSARDPRYVYGGCYQGLIDERDMTTGITRDIMPWPEMNLTEPTDRTRYRFNWTAPIVVSRHDANVLYHGGNVLFRSIDRGQSWTPASPDLSRNDRSRQGWGGTPITNEGAGGEVYGTIIVIHEDPRDARTLWIGTDDGRVQVTRDGGTTWSDVTPRGAGDGLVNEIEVSPFDANTVWIAYRTNRMGDPAPHVFRTTDGGRTWVRTVTGLREGEPVRVVREDPERRGLLYAGTETGIYVSRDNGAQWQPFPARFPVVPVTDLAVHRGDLVAATEGRAFWILDDLSTLRQHADSLLTAPLHLHAPRPAVLAEGQGGFGGGGRNVGRNPPAGAMIHYRLGSAPDSTSPVTLELLDARGTVVRSFSSRATDAGDRLPARAGVNLLVWNLRRRTPTTLAGVELFGAPRGGARVPAGRYTVRLTANGTTRTQPLDVLPDPRVTTPPALVAERDAVAASLSERLGEINDAVLRVREARGQVQAALTRARDAENAAAITAAGKALTTKLETMDPRLTTKAGNGQDIINYANGFNGQVAFLLGQVEGNTAVTQPVRDRMRELDAQWAKLRAELDAIESDDIPAFNRLLEAGKVPGVTIRKVTPVRPPIS